jgi:hypothetical protein
MTHHGYDTVIDLQAALGKEELWSRPFRLDVDLDGEIVTGFTFVPELDTESVVYANDGRGNMVQERSGFEWVTEYVPEGWAIDRLCDPAQFLGGNVLRNMMDDVVDAAPESYVIYCVETALIDAAGGEDVSDDDVVGWVILSRNVDATTAPSVYTAQQIRDKKGHINVPIPAGWPDVEIDDSYSVLSADDVKFTGTVVHIYGRGMDLQVREA